MVGKEQGALLWAVSKTDGRKLSETKLEALPAFDGLIAAGDLMYMSTMEGTLICFGQE